MICMGKISSINYTKARARVIYPDQDESVSAELPFLESIQRIPEIGEFVAVAKFSDRSGSGVILGPILSPASMDELREVL